MSEFAYQVTRFYIKRPAEYQESSDGRSAIAVLKLFYR